MSDEVKSFGIEQARAALGDLVLDASRAHRLSDAITMISRYGRDVAAIVPAAVATDALDDEQPYPSETYRVALAVHSWRKGHRGKRLSELPERELGRALGLAEALQAASQQGTADVYLAPHPVEATPDRLEWVAEMLTLADDMVDEWTAWVQSRT